MKNKIILPAPKSRIIRNKSDRLAISDIKNIVKLPMDIALPYAAEQNFQSDLRRGIVKDHAQWTYEEESYVEEAAMLLMYNEGSNFMPLYEDLPWIQVCKTGTVLTSASSRRAALIDMIAFHYDNPTKFARPDPRTHNDHFSIMTYRNELSRRFQFH